MRPLRPEEGRVHGHPLRPEGRVQAGSGVRMLPGALLPAIVRLRRLIRG